ncbi:MAG: hypothetical protein P1S60_09970 [Anaerolineae bacterium]|nr:hypothetical protein [Anaerolineae bacterium]
MTRVDVKRRLNPCTFLAVAASAALFAAVLFNIGSFSIDPRYAPPETETSPTSTPWPTSIRFTGPELGINVHMWWDPWAAVARDWSLIDEGGFTWVKQRLSWHDVEGAGPGRYEWTSADRIVDEANQLGINLVFRVDMPPVWAMPEENSPDYTRIPAYPEAFQHFCYELASRYQDRVRGYQVWNEPNLAREWRDQTPNPEAYVALLRACYFGVKTADPDALVISAGLAPTGSGLPEAIPDVTYLSAMYEAGAAPYFDLLGLNAPGYKAPPELSPEVVTDPDSGFGGHPTFCFRHVENMRAVMETYGDANKQIAILEFGWHSDTNPEHEDYAWFAVTPEQQADYLVRAYQYAHEHWASWVGPMFVWNFPDPKWTPENEEFWWSVADPFWWGAGEDMSTWKGGAVRPAYLALKALRVP